MASLPDGESCAQCRYFIDAVGECRRNPPSVWLATASYREQSLSIRKRIIVSWPPVKPEDWCGNFGKVLGQPYPAEPQ